jgi:hypothetical protein
MSEATPTMLQQRQSRGIPTSVVLGDSSVAVTSTLRDVSGLPFSAATLRSQLTSAIEHAGMPSRYIWEGKCHPVLLSESLWETMVIDLAVANSRHFYHLVISH